MCLKVKEIRFCLWIWCFSSLHTFTCCQLISSRLVCRPCRVIRVIKREANMPSCWMLEVEHTEVISCCCLLHIFTVIVSSHAWTSAATCSFTDTKTPHRRPLQQSNCLLISFKAPRGLLVPQNPGRKPERTNRPASLKGFHWKVKPFHSASYLHTCFNIIYTFYLQLWAPQLLLFKIKPLST